MIAHDDLELPGEIETGPAAWQQGYPLSLLRPLSAVFGIAHGPYVHGAFGLVKERDIALALKDGRCLHTPQLDSCLIYLRYASAAAFSDFTGTKHQVPAGALMIKSAAGPAVSALFDALPSAQELWAECYQEDAAACAFYTARGFVLRAVKISASSDIIGVYKRTVETAGPLCSDADLIGLKVLLPGFITPEECAAIAEEIAAFSQWQDHYSGYNLRHSWSAYALRGYDATDPAFIEKPAEMARRWQQEHPERMQAECQATPAAALHPVTMSIVSRLPSTPERVRMMRLKAGGELARHADITDRAAGTRDNAIVRMHIPIITDPRVLVTSWDLHGMPHRMHMPAQALCYLDTRKPHRAVNESAQDRIHLVIDLHSSGSLRRLLTA